MDVCSTSLNFISYAGREDRRGRSSQAVCVVLRWNSLAESSDFWSQEASNKNQSPYLLEKQ